MLQLYLANIDYIGSIYLNYSNENLNISTHQYWLCYTINYCILGHNVIYEIYRQHY